MALVILGGMVFPAPAGTDMSTPEGLKAAMPMLEAKHFLFPFLAHALGTLVGAFITARNFQDKPLRSALMVAAVFLAGGIQMIVEYGGPIWFQIADLGLAYLPMGWLGYKLADKSTH